MNLNRAIIIQMTMAFIEVFLFLLYSIHTMNPNFKVIVLRCTMMMMIGIETNMVII